MIEITNDPTRRVITLRASGVVRLEDMRQALKEYIRATGLYRGRPHFLLADMRGMAPLSPDAAATMGEAIAHGRQRGVVLCAHLSDSGIVRLQSNRLAREVAGNDDATVDVIALEEAWRLFDERREQLGVGA